MHTVQVIANSIRKHEFNTTQHAFDKTCPAWHDTITDVKGFLHVQYRDKSALEKPCLVALQSSASSCGSNNLKCTCYKPPHTGLALPQ